MWNIIDDETLEYNGQQYDLIDGIPVYSPMERLSFVLMKVLKNYVYAWEDGNIVEHCR